MRIILTLLDLFQKFPYAFPMLEDRESPTQWQRPGWSLLVVLLLALTLRILNIQNHSLCYDDMYGANFASDGFFHMLADVLRFDIHPPVYFFQLWAWMHVYPGGDLWAMANSVLWSLLSVVSVYVVADRVFGRRVAITSALLLAVVPIHVEFARQIRQYSFLTALMPWAWYFTRAYLLEGPGRRRFPLMVLSTLLVIYSLGSGLVQAMFIGLAGLGMIADHRPPRGRVVGWFKGQFLIVGLSLPAFANGLLRSHSDHLIEPGWTAIKKVGAYLLAGNYYQDASWAALLFYGGLAIMTATAFFMRKGRWLVLVFGPMTFLFTGVISYTIRPMWHFRQFIFLLPFLSMGLALTFEFIAQKMAERLRDRSFVSANRVFAGLVSAQIAFGTYVCYVESTTHIRPPTYKMALDYIKEELQPGDVILVPHNSDFWGVAWYFAGPRWGSPVAIQDRILEHAAPNKWGKILRKMGPEWARRLLLAPEQPFIEHEGVKLYVGYGSGPEVASLQPERVYVVNFPQIGAHDRPMPSIPGYFNDPAERQWFQPSPSYVGIEVIPWRRDKKALLGQQVAAP